MKNLTRYWFLTATCIFGWATLALADGPILPGGGTSAAAPATGPAPGAPAGPLGMFLPFALMFCGGVFFNDSPATEKSQRTARYDVPVETG